MTIPSSEIPPDNDVGTTLEQFRQALTRSIARRSMGLDLTDEKADAIAADEALSASWYKFRGARQRVGLAHDIACEPYFTLRRIQPGQRITYCHPRDGSQTPGYSATTARSRRCQRGPV
ncbi:hypothetical protein GCM10009776_33420 [Microbacterium deminutum]|uniref:Uncharacterized protein n=1 Tax=Microbacterium deminutum TaxID=344164 RepID=A0ABN2REH6_9MICO